jgi:hypothetical protein
MKLDIAKCNKSAQQGPGGVRRAALIAILSIRKAWITVPEQLNDVLYHGVDSKYLNGWKRQAFKFLWDGDNIDYLYTGTMSATDEQELLDLWLTVPGLGLAKAGFVCQLTRGWVGCVDSHNAKRYGVPANQLRYNKKLSARALVRKQEEYIALTHAIGGSEYMWKEWCYLMWGKYPDRYAMPEHVSQQHVDLMEVGR